MDISFKDRVAIVTGAGGGLGRSYALEIARRGGAIVVNDLGGNVEGEGGSPEMADAVVAEIEAAGGRAVASYDSVASVAGASRIVDTAIEHFGRIDALINNAGNMRIAPFEESTGDDLDSHLAVHLVGSFNVTKEAWPHMTRQGYGRIVFTASSAGMFGNELQSCYGAAKAGVFGLMNVLALEGEKCGILCNAVMPNAYGRMASKMAETLDRAAMEENAATLSAIGKSMEPEFNAGIAVYLASDACGTSHSAYSCCGGRIARVFVGATEGWQGSRETAASAEDIAANIDRIRDPSAGVHIPERPSDEMRIAVTKPKPVV